MSKQPNPPIYQLHVPTREGKKVYHLPIWAILTYFSALKKTNRRFTWTRKDENIHVKTGRLKNV